MKHDDFLDSLSYGIAARYPKRGKSEMMRQMFEERLNKGDTIFAPWSFKLYEHNTLSEEMLAYCKADVRATMEVFNTMNGIEPKIRVKKLIFDYPATIVYWYDGTKTVVKCREGETFDKETGLAMAICKKLIGDKYKSCFRSIIKGAIVKHTEPEKSNMEKLNDVLNNIIDDIDEVSAKLHTAATNEITNLLESEDDKSGLLT